MKYNKSPAPPETWSKSPPSDDAIKLWALLDTIETRWFETDQQNETSLSLFYAYAMMQTAQRHKILWSDGVDLRTI